MTRRKSSTNKQAIFKRVLSRLTGAVVLYLLLGAVLLFLLERQPASFIYVSF